MTPASVRSPIRRAGIAVALALAGAVALLLAPQLEDEGPAPRTAGRDAPVNPGARDPGDISAHNSPTIARNPRDARQLAVTSRIDSPDFSCALHVSADGGRRWTATEVPIPRGEPPKCFAPDAAFGADGRLHVSYVTLRGEGNTPSAVWVASSRDGGRTLGAPRRVAGPLGFQVRIAADPARPRRLYVTWVRARDVGTLRFTGPGNPVVVSRSDDGGSTWSRPARASDPARGRVLAPSPAVGRAGELYVLYLDARGDRLDYEGSHDASGGPPHPGRFALVLARSRDRGATWQESVVDDRIVPARRFVAFLPPFPALAVDRGSGRVYVGFEDARRGSADVSVWALDPGASGWRGPVRVNDTRGDDRTSQYLPGLAVAPGGRLDVVYYDRREDRRRNRRNEVSLQSSTDGARSFGPRLTLTSRDFDARIGAGSERGLPDLGSRLGLVSGREDAVAVWADTRAGTDASHKQDLVRATVSFGDGGRGGGVTALRIAGVLLLVAALGFPLALRHWTRR